MRKACEAWKRLLQNRRRKEVCKTAPKRPVVQYTDASLEACGPWKGVPTTGLYRVPEEYIELEFGIVIILQGCDIHVWSGKIPASRLRSKLGLPYGERVTIAHAELYTIGLAQVLARDLLEGEDVLAFCDNETATAIIAKGYSSSASLAQMAGWIWSNAVDLGVSYFFEGVLSELNIADGPSRGDTSIVRKLGPCVIKKIMEWPQVSVE